jgi:hypothetical protein
MPKTLRQNLRTCVAVVLMTSLGGNAYAGACATQEDRLAIRAAAIQQRLMVAAFTCNATGQYNKFVLAYQGDLQQSDDALKDFFLRSNRNGTADYHAFKTRLANTASIESSRDPRRYCADARALFQAAFKPRRAELAVFIDDRATKWEKDFPACTNRTQVAGGR